ncbi:hypothetical protein CVT24_010097 [Panaeolus cyanescens]|uniref:F-box domain-containing protein n=1 Tax=Panaeolus cyanescens TaxID=181874 RepID=A0A409W9G8_9AGAR|nr:hypothetical protein CVT24_010097 [Panaeolus cyanescens]
MVKGGAQGTAAGSNKRKRKAPVKTKDEDTNENLKVVKKPKKLKKQQGALTKLLDMPLDILLEIFGHLQPADLLSLGRVSQEFRQLVMSAEFKCIWIQCRTRLADNSPECPQDITEPMFAELVFGKGCLNCKRVGVHLHTLWQARTRLCTNCISKTFVSATFIRPLKLPQDIFDMVPSIKVKRDMLYSPKYANMWAKEYHALKTAVEQVKWEKTKLRYLRSVAKHAKACEAWVVEAKHSIEAEKDRNVEERQAKLLEMAKEMGWADEILRRYFKDLPFSSELDKICQKPFTDESIEKAKVIINDMMKNTQEERLTEEKEELFRSRMEVLQTAYDQAVQDWLPTNNAPYISDFFVVPHIRSVVVDTPPEFTVTREHFFDKDTFSGLVEEARSIRRKKCLEVIANGYKKIQTIKAEYDPETVLNLATTAFTFENYRLPENTSFNAAQALSWKSSLALLSGSQKLPLVERVALQVFKYSPWNAENAIIFNWMAHDIITNLMNLCGIDPLTTTLMEMNTLDPIFECVPCNKMSRGRLMMRWATAVSHIKTTHYSDTSSSVSFIEVPNAEELARVRKEIKETKERRAYSNNIDTKCKHCDDGQVVGKLHSMRRHLFDKHEVRYPEDKDWEFVGTLTKVQEHWLWPPRHLEGKPCTVLGVHFL